MTDSRAGRRGGAAKGGRGNGDVPSTTRAEWVVAIVAALLVLGAIAQVMIDAFSGPDGPPSLTVSVDSIAPVASGYRVSFTVRNDGGTTAAAVQIDGTLKQDTVMVESSSAIIDYVPSQARRSGGLFFSGDPRRHRLELRAAGYDEP